MLRKLRARIRGEVPSSRLGAFRRAGADAYALLGDEGSPERRIAVWNAFVRQRTADLLLEHPYLTRDAAEQARALYSGAAEWLVRAREAEVEGYRLDVHVPESLPRLFDERWTHDELDSLRTAANDVYAHVERAGAPERVERILVAARSRLDYAESLWQDKIPRDIAASLGFELVEALALAHLAGQLLAMPSLLDDAQPVPGFEAPPLPGEPGFDPWLLTDPEEAARLTLQPYCHAQLRALWTADPDPARTIALHGEIASAVARGDVQRMPPRTTELAAVSRDCPWPPIFVALRALAIGGHNIEALQPFALVVREEPTGFRRTLVVGPRIHVPERRRDYGPQPSWSDDVLGALNPLNLFDL